MARFLYHTSCPKCNSRDNRGVYDDESSYCFGCGYTSSGRYVPPHEIEEKDENPLPTDLTQEYPKAALEWITKYNITVEEGLRHNVYYSRKFNQLLFCFYGNTQTSNKEDFPSKADGSRSGISIIHSLNGISIGCNPRGTQGNEAIKTFASARNLSSGYKSRYTTYGEILPEHCRIIPTTQMGQKCSIDSSRTRRLLRRLPRRTLVLVEDCLSAIKIARQSDSYPLLTSTISLGSIKALASLLDPSTGVPRYTTFLIWLDGNMFHRAQRIARQFQMLGKEARAVYTEKDPKEYGDIEIAKTLDNTP